MEVADDDLEPSHTWRIAWPTRLPTISSHVLDTSRGSPQPGVSITVSKVGANGPETAIGTATTDADGRIADLLGRPLETGTYRLRFELGERSAFFAALVGRHRHRRRPPELPRAAAAQPVRPLDVPGQLIAVAAELPSIEELNRLPTPDFAAALAPLFEGAPRFLTRLAMARPFAGYAELWPAALRDRPGDARSRTSSS